MPSRDAVHRAKGRMVEILAAAGITITPAERERIEVADFGLDELDTTGLQLLTYVNNERYCAKELVLFSGQTCPEHRHPRVGADPGKTETFRCRQGLVWLYVDGPPAARVRATVPRDSSEYYTVFQEIELRPGEQYTIPPDTLHWFQGGPEGAIVSEFSSTSRDEFDVFTDPRIVRVPASR
jgi:D-lyxose ketol-isomerase